MKKIKNFKLFVGTALFVQSLMLAAVIVVGSSAVAFTWFTLLFSNNNAGSADGAGPETEYAASFLTDAESYAAASPGAVEAADLSYSQ